MRYEKQWSQERTILEWERETVQTGPRLYFAFFAQDLKNRYVDQHNDFRPYRQYIMDQDTPQKYLIYTVDYIGGHIINNWRVTSNVKLKVRTSSGTAVHVHRD